MMQLVFVGVDEVDVLGHDGEHPLERLPFQPVAGVHPRDELGVGASCRTGKLGKAGDDTRLPTADGLPAYRIHRRLYYIVRSVHRHDDDRDSARRVAHARNSARSRCHARSTRPVREPSSRSASAIASLYRRSSISSSSIRPSASPSRASCPMRSSRSTRSSWRSRKFSSATPLLPGSTCASASLHSYGARCWSTPSPRPKAAFCTPVETSSVLVRNVAGS